MTQNRVPMIVLFLAAVLIPGSAGLHAQAGRAMEKTGRTLHIASGGVGYGGYVRVSMWLLNNLVKQEPNANLWIDYHLTARRFRDGVLVLANRGAEISLVNSHGLASMALRGKGLFDRPIPLRGIANLPQHGWATFAVDAKLGIRSFADLKAKKTPLKIATGYLDGDNAVGFLLLELFKRHGIDPEEFKSWGGRFLEGIPSFTQEQIRSGGADAIFNEAFDGEDAKETARKRPLTFLGADPGVAKQMQDEYGWPFVTAPANHYPGQDTPFLAPDFSDWLICVREDMDDETAYRLAQIAVEKREELDVTRNYGTVNFGGVDPNNRRINLQTVSKTSIPLHPGARRYYQEKGLLRE